MAPWRISVDFQEFAGSIAAQGMFSVEARHEHAVTWLRRLRAGRDSGSGPAGRSAELCTFSVTRPSFGSRWAAVAARALGRTPLFANPCAALGAGRCSFVGASKLMEAGLARSSRVTACLSAPQVASGGTFDLGILTCLRCRGCVFGYMLH